MYPLNFFALFPPFARKLQIFVAMSFEDQFHERWEKVIKPGIGRVEHNGQRLKAYRVDARTVGDSILTDILQGITESLLVFCDITALHEVGGRWCRNGNVMYELGLAHAVRLPEEVLVFRSDRHPLLFDVGGVRIRDYEPDPDPNRAASAICEAITDALSEVDRCRSLTVDRVIEQLDLPMWELLGKAVNGSLSHPAYRTVDQALGHCISGPAIRSLISLGCVRAEYRKWTLEWLKENADKPMEGLIAYQATGLGLAVFKKVGDTLTGDDPAVWDFINKPSNEDAGAS